MKKSIFLLLVVVACGGSSQGTAVQDTTTTTAQDTTSTTVPKTTTTLSTTTTTTSTTTTLPPTTGVGLDENGNEIMPGIKSIEIIKPNTSAGETFSYKRYSKEEIDSRPLDALRGNEIELMVEVVPGTNPIYSIQILFGIINSDSSIKLVGACDHRVGNDRKNKIDLLYKPENINLFCGDFNNNRQTSNFGSFSQEVGDVSILSVDVYDNYENYTRYWTPLASPNGIYVKEGFTTSLGEVNTEYEKPTEKYISFFPTEIIFKVTR